MNTDRTIPTFWTSAAVAEIIASRAASAKARLPSAETAWISLRTGIIRDNTLETFPDFRWHLFTLVELLRTFRKNLEGYYGTDCWTRAENILRDDARAVAVMRFIRRLTSATPLDAVESLTRIGRCRDRLRYALPAGGTKAIGGKDCGMGALVEVCGQIEKALDAEIGKGLPSAQFGCENAASHPVKGARVTIKLLGGQVLNVRYAGRNCRLTKTVARMFFSLYAHHNEGQTFAELWKSIHGDGEAYEPDRGGPPQALRTMKCLLNRLLVKDLGKPPRGDHWIVAESRIGYRLTPAVEHWTLLDRCYEGMREFLRDPRKLDGNNVDDRD